MKLLIISSVVALATLVNSQGQNFGQVSANGLDRSFSFGRGYGNDKLNGGGLVFGSHGPNGKNPNYGGQLFLNGNGHGATFTHSRSPGAVTNEIGGKLNVFQSGDHKINLNAAGSRTRLHKRQINTFDRYSGNVEYEHSRGHGASIGLSSIPKFDHKTVDANAKLNLWRSPDQRTTFDANAGISKNIGSFDHGRTNKNIGLTFSHRF